MEVEAAGIVVEKGGEIAIRGLKGEEPLEEGFAFSDAICRLLAKEGQGETEILIDRNDFVVVDKAGARALPIPAGRNGKVKNAGLFL